jgi:CRISPR-associated protein Csx10
LFGTPEKPKRWYFSSARPVDLEQPLPQNTWRPGHDGAQQVTRVRVDPRTRRAKPRQLFSKEVGDGSLKFRFEATCHAADEVALDEAALLVAIARYVRQLGGSRRRGLGECVIHLTEVDGADVTEAGLLQRFRKVWLDGTLHPLEEKPKPTYLGDLSIPAYNQRSVRVRFVVRLDEPLVIAERAAAGNQFDTRHVIPGGVIRGALAGRAARRNDLSDPQTYTEFVALFLRGGVTFPNLYLAHHDNNNLYPTIPAPLGLLTCEVDPFQRGREGHGLWTMGSSKTKDRKCPECGGRLEPVGGFMVLKQKGPYTVTSDEKVELHIRIDPKSNRVSQGNLYGYTVLSVGQYFVGELRCADENAWSRLQELTGSKDQEFFSLRLGKARRRGYGRVKVWTERCNDQPVTWLQVPLEKRVPNLAEPVTLTLLSDALVVDRWGRQAAAFDEAWLKQELKLGLVEIKDTSARARDVDGFHDQTGLPRWRDRVLRAGSMAVIKFTSPPQDWQERMKRLEVNGIGLRRNEGFGRIAFNHPVYKQCQSVTGSHIQLPEKMCLGKTSSDEPITSERQFVQRWANRLKQRFGLEHCDDQRFGALARCLHAHSHIPPKVFVRFFTEDRDCDKVDLEKVFGEPDDTLIEAIGKVEYGARSKDNFFAGKGKTGFKVVCEALKSLEKEDSQHWPLGIQMLAERIAAAAETEKEERK